MQSITDLLGNRRTVLPKGRVLNERAELVKFFYDQHFTNKDGTRCSKKQIGVRLGHYKLSELYALKSAYVDRLQRNGKETARKYYWYITKTERV